MNLNQFLSNMTHYDQALDARGLTCPLPILKAKKALARLVSGQTLCVLATDPGAIKDFEAFAKQTGHELLDSRQSKNDFQFLLRKK